MSSFEPSASAASSALDIFRCVTYPALAFHIWEWASGFSFEINNIWVKKYSSVVKWQYLLSRYVGLASQVGNTIMAGYLRLSRASPRQLCLGWYIEQIMIAQGLLFILELSLIQRLYALSGSNDQLKMALQIIILAEHTIYTACLAVSVRQVEFVEACLLKEPPIELAIISCAVGVTQCILWSLTIQSAWRAPLTSLVMRDGSWVFGLVSVFLVGSTANMFSPKNAPAFSPFSAFVTVIVNSNCRLIMNLEGMGRKQRDTNSTIEFTSHVDIGEYASEDQYSRQTQLPVTSEIIVHDSKISLWELPLPGVAVDAPCNHTQSSA